MSSELARERRTRLCSGQLPACHANTLRAASQTLKDITPRDDELAFARQAERIGVTRADGFQLERLDVAAVAGLKRGVLLVAPGAARFSI